jgi:hypothetical protein
MLHTFLLNKLKLNLINIIKNIVQQKNE